MFDSKAFFYRLTEYLKEREKTIRSLAVMVAPELWLSLEAAALLDNERNKFGIRGRKGNKPNWYVAAEMRKVDIWIADSNTEPKNATAIEFKVIHNNKNFYNKIWGIRNDLRKEKVQNKIRKSIPNPPYVNIFGIVMLIYTRYLEEIGDEGFVYLKNQNRKVADFKNFLNLFRENIELSDKWYKDAPKLEIISEDKICLLDGSNYIEDGHESQVLLFLLKQK